jgi:hypothetical protein
MTVYLTNSGDHSLRMATFLNQQGHTVVLEPYASENNLAQGEAACAILAHAYEEMFYAEGAAR